MAYTIISQNNTTTTLQDENGNIIYVPGRVTLATSTDYTITEVNNNTATLTDGSGKVIRDVPCVVVLAGGGSSDTHNKGYYATPEALAEAEPTAEAGDWAIVGSTDTVWVWDSDTNAWKDTDTKGQVTSVNGQTGDVVIPNELPSQTGQSGKFLTTDGTDASWAAVDALPSQTGQSGKFLTTDGTDASWATVNALQNTATGANSLTVAGTAATQDRGTNIGVFSQAGYGGTACGIAAKATGQYSTAIGDASNATQDSSLAIGRSADATASKAIGINGKATASYAIQIGGAGGGHSNTVANTFKVANANGNYEMMSADGTIPTARLTKVNTTITLAAADWSAGTQTVTVSGVTSTSVVLVAPDPSDTADYVAAGILCTSQTTDSLTFTATTTPTNDIDVNIVCL